MSRQGNSYYRFERAEMRRFVPPHYDKVLEVGCGAGSFRSNLDKPNEYWGVEQDADTAKAATSLLDKVIVGSYHEVSNQLPDHYFDLIICNDVIEHMENHIDFLLRIKQKLSAGGSLIISVPNVRYIANLAELLFKKDWRYREAGILDSTHLRFFTKKSLIQILRETGWQVNDLSGINRYGSHRIGHKLLFSYIGQIVFGADTAYMQFAATLTVPPADQTSL